MPRFTFHIENGHRISSDEEALPNEKAAQREAESIAQDLSRNRTDRQKLRIVATDEMKRALGWRLYHWAIASSEQNACSPSWHS
jgi:hypothetical protein